MRFGVLSWVLLLAGACRGPEPAARNVLSEPRAVEPLSNAVFMPDGGWGRVELSDVALTLEMPDATGWRTAGGKDWLRLEHPESNSRLEVRRLRVAAHARPSDCASEAGLGSASDDSGEWIERRSVLTPDELRIDLAVGLNPPTGDPALVGTVEAAAVGSRACVAIRVRTSVQGAGGEAELARRLGTFADRVVPSLKLLRVEDRIGVPREPGPTRP